jgi:hypothetical protein
MRLDHPDDHPELLDWIGEAANLAATAEVRTRPAHIAGSPDAAGSGDQLVAADQEAGEQVAAGVNAIELLAALVGQVPVAETALVSMGGCIASALMGWSAVEGVGAVLGTVSSRTRRGVDTLATR